MFLYEFRNEQNKMQM